MAEVKSLEAKISLSTEEIKQAGTLDTGFKVTGKSGSGTVTLHHVTSYMKRKIGENLQNGKTTVAKIVSAVNDPQSRGEERVTLLDCVFTELTLANWELGKMGEESIPFNFSQFELTNMIE